MGKVLIWFRDNGMFPFYDSNDWVAFIVQLVCVGITVWGMTIQPTVMGITVVLLFTVLWTLPFGLRFREASDYRPLSYTNRQTIFMSMACLTVVALSGCFLADISMRAYAIRISVVLFSAGCVLLFSPNPTER